jgi:hypothetical protein
MSSRGWARVVAANASLMLASLVFWTWPKALPIPNLDVTLMVIALVALILTTIGFTVYFLNRVVDEANYAIVSEGIASNPGKGAEFRFAETMGEQGSPQNEELLASH